jgi:polar amino acid transport system substrate-binding protein
MRTWGKQRAASRGVVLALVVGVALVAAAGCGGDDETSSKPKEVRLTAPETLVKADTLTFCSDIGYPPMEFEGEDGAPTGADIEIAGRLAELMDVEVAFRPTPFDDVLTALDDEACDAVISSLTNTAERREQVAFVDYLRFGQSLMVPTANDHDIDGLDDLDGLRVAVQSGTTSEDLLKERVAEGDDPPVVRPFAKDTDATAAVKAGTADAYLGDSPVVAYHIGQEALTYAFAGDPIDPEPIGIAVRLDDDELREQLERGIDGMYADGSMERILARWKLEDFTIE